MITLTARLSQSEAEALAHILHRLTEHDIGRRGLRLASHATEQTFGESALSQLRQQLRQKGIGPA